MATKKRQRRNRRLSRQHTVTAPDATTERPEPYYSYVADFLTRRCGVTPSRTTLGKWISNGRGYPVQRGGPYIAMPIFRRLKKPMTTREAMSRWLTTLRDLERQEGLRK